MADTLNAPGRGRSAAAVAAAVLDRVTAAVSAVAMAVAAASLLVSLGVVAYGVVARYVLNRPQPWTDELVGYLLVGVVMLAAADALRKGEHIGVDVLTERLGPRGKRLAAAFGLVTVLLSALALLVEGWETVAFTKMLGIMSTGYLAMPMHWPQALIPLGGALLLLAGLAALARLAVGLPPVDAGGHHPPEVPPGGHAGTQVEEGRT